MDVRLVGPFGDDEPRARAESDLMEMGERGQRGQRERERVGRTAMRAMRTTREPDIGGMMVEHQPSMSNQRFEVSLLGHIPSHIHPLLIDKLSNIALLSTPFVQEESVMEPLVKPQGGRPEDSVLRVRKLDEDGETMTFVSLSFDYSPLISS